MNRNLVLDRIFNEKIGLTKHTFDIYKQIYNLKDIEFEGPVSEELFKYVKKRKYFILLAIYDHQGKIYLSRNVQENLYWSLPGGSLKENENLHSAVKRIALKIDSKLIIGEIEPIAFVTNTFRYKDKSYTHEGIGFVARIRNQVDINMNNLEGRFVHINDDELSKINRFANQKLAVLCKQRYGEFFTEFPELEIRTNEENQIRYYIHNNIVKKYFLTPKIKKKAEFYKLILEKVGKCNSIIDVSCGDSNLLLEINNNSNNIDFLIANDISWSQVDILNKLNSHKKSNNGIIFTNHNAVYFPFKNDSFDVAICSNTLHHMQSSNDLITLLNSMLRIASKIIIIEIENPHVTGFIPKVLNKYWYINFLRDVGGAYLAEDEFKTIINETFSKRASIEFTSFKNIQGKYMIAKILKKKSNDFEKIVSNPVIEVEDKYFLSDNIQLSKLITILKEKGFIASSEDSENDQYFTDIKGDFIKNRTCLRLRYSLPNNIEMTFKGKTVDFNSWFAKEEINLQLDGNYLNSAEIFFTSLGYHKYVNVSKTRKTYSKHIDDLQYNVVVDKLSSIGTFVEFEIIAPQKNNYFLKSLNEKLMVFLKDFSSLCLKKANKPYRDFIATHIKENILFKENLNAIFIDFDGTLFPTEKIFLDSWKVIAKKKYNIQISDEEYIRWELSENSKMIEELKSIGRLSNDIEPDDFMEDVYLEYENRINEFLKTQNNVEALSFILRQLKNYYKLAIVSTSRRKYIDIILDNYLMKDMFDIIISREDVTKLKPNKEAYQLALKKLNLKPNECLVVEDSIRGIKAAQNATINTVAVTSNTITPSQNLDVFKINKFDSFINIALILLYS